MQQVYNFVVNIIMSDPDAILYFNEWTFNGVAANRLDYNNTIMKSLGYTKTMTQTGCHIKS